MPTARASLVTGPAKIERGGAFLYSLEDIPINIIQDTLPIVTSAHGQIDERSLDARIEASFTPEGRWDIATRALLWPYANTVPGTSIFGSDTATIFHGSDGAKHTIVASAITAMPSIFLSAARTMVGPVTITGIRKDNTAWDVDDNLYIIGSSATFADATPFTPSLIKVQSFVGDWTDGVTSVTGFDAIDTLDGWTIDFDLQLDPIVIDDIGTVDMRFRSLSVMARCIPINPTPAQIRNNLKISEASSGSKRGRSLATTNDLIITGADATTKVTLQNAALRSAGFRFGATVLREGEIGFVATRPFSAGAQQAIFSLA